jgi:hypothetical protein
LDFATDVYNFGSQFNESNVPLMRRKRALDASISSFFTVASLSWVGVAFVEIIGQFLSTPQKGIRLTPEAVLLL